MSARARATLMMRVQEPRAVPLVLVPAVARAAHRCVRSIETTAGLTQTSVNGRSRPAALAPPRSSSSGATETSSQRTKRGTGDGESSSRQQQRSGFRPPAPMTPPQLRLAPDRGRNPRDRGSTPSRPQPNDDPRYLQSRLRWGVRRRGFKCRGSHQFGPARTHHVPRSRGLG